ncbi:MAG: Gfo/Idh/MocA family oxidoreductase [bacterium]|jgi:predicted dehydrogenase|nr:Gfo/Idh/MocA family oxidoreductase [bacterium]
MSNPTRILLVGCGRMNLSHVAGLKKLPEMATLVAGVDPSESARRNIEAEHGIAPTYADLHDALAKVDADAAIIAVPNNLHAEYTHACLKKGLHVLIEKPMALNLADVDAMIAAAEARGLLLMSGQSQRFSNAIRYVKHLLDNRAVGNIRHVAHRRLGSGRGGDENSWFAKQALSGGILPGIGVHSLDVLLWWMNDRATSVSAIVKNIDPHPAIDIDDEASLIAHTEKGAILNCALSFHHSAGTDWTVMGDEGVLHLNGTNGPLLINGKEQVIPNSVVLPGEDQIHTEFLTAIRTKRPLAQASAQDVRKTMALIFAAMESGRTLQTVAVS